MSKFDELINSETPVLMQISAEWFEPCKVMAPILKDVASKVGRNAKIIKVDIDKNPNAITMFNVESVPTLIIFKKGEIKWRQFGIIQAGPLVEALLFS